MAKEIPVYLFVGFLESGKTSFIASVLQDPGFTRDESTLIIQCEEGETEYEPDMLKKTHSVVECIEDEDEYNGDTLRAFVRKHHPDRVAALGEDVRKAAERKFQEINEAKETIYKARGMR